MFPNLHSMFTVPAAVQNAPLDVQISAMRDQLAFLKDLDNSSMFGPGVHQLEGDISGTGILQTRGSHTGIRSRMDGGFPARCVNPSAPAGRALRTKAAVTSPAPRESIQAPPMPPSFAKGRHKNKNPNAVNAEEYWKFTWRLLCERGKAIGSLQIAQAFDKHMLQQSRPKPAGHKSWWSRDRVLMLQMYEMARVPIEDQYCKQTLQSFWRDYSKEVLAWLTGK